MALCLALAAAALALAGRVSGPALRDRRRYLVLNAAYSAGLKHVAILDVFMIAAGFMLRILAGTTGHRHRAVKWLLLSA